MRSRRISLLLWRRINENCITMAYDVKDIAKKIIAKTDTEHGDTISNLKLQKMLYYMQGFHLAFFGTPLFEEEIKAWQYGPVVPSVYEEYKRYESKAIDLPEGPVIELTEDEEAVFDNVYDEYNQFSAVALMKMTHEESPWRSTEISQVIDKEKIKQFFNTQIVA